MAPPTILIVGATGNTGQSAVCTLSSLLLAQGNTTTRILGLTRSLASDNAQQLAQLANVEMLEKNWTSIDADWLTQQHVQRAYVVPHINADQFTDETRLYVAMLGAGVEYIVRVSTTTQYVTPNNSDDFGRAHWAAEQLLSQPEFAKLHWTSLQPSNFAAMFLGFAKSWVDEYRTTGKAPVLEMTLTADQPASLIDPRDIGDVAAHLLALADPTPHNRAKYVLNGPEDFTGRQLVELFEKVAGVKVDKVNYQSTKFLDMLISIGALTKESKPWFLGGFAPLWAGECARARAPTSQAVMELAPPKRTGEGVVKAMLHG